MKATKAQLAALAARGAKISGPRVGTPAKRSKYGAVETHVDGIRFQSKREAEYYRALVLLVQSGKVGWFARQPRFVLEGGVEYVADFVEYWNDGTWRITDVKGVRTPVYRLKRRQIKARYGIDIEEV